MPGLCMSTCFGLFLFTRILIPDVMLTSLSRFAMWAFLRALDEEEPRPRFWAFVLAASLGTGLLFKSLVGVLFPVAAGVIYLVLTRQLFRAKIWKRLHPFSGLLIVLLIAAPWHVLATLRNPPYFDFTLHSAPGEYHGFLWFYFINEQLLRFLNLRYPRDYNTVPRLYFWLFHCSGCFPGASICRPSPSSPSGRSIAPGGRDCWRCAGPASCWSSSRFPRRRNIIRCLAIRRWRCCWARRWRLEAVGCGAARAVLAAIAGCAAVAALILSLLVRNVPAPGDISAALSAQSGRLYAFARPHGRSHARVVRLSSPAAAGGRGRVSRWSGGNACAPPDSARSWPRR